MTEQHLKKLKDFIDKHGTNIDVIAYGLNVSQYDAISGKGEIPIECGIVLSCNFIPFASLSLLQRLKHALFPIKLTRLK